MYVGDHVAYDGREGAIGATDVKVLGDKSICYIRAMSVAVRPRFTKDTGAPLGTEVCVCDAAKVSSVIQKVIKSA